MAQQSIKGFLWVPLHNKRTGHELPNKHAVVNSVAENAVKSPVKSPVDCGHANLPVRDPKTVSKKVTKAIKKQQRKCHSIARKCKSTKPKSKSVKKNNNNKR